MTTKTVLTQRVAEIIGLPHEQVSGIVDLFLGEVGKALIAGEKVSLPHFGAFIVSESSVPIPLSGAGRGVGYTVQRRVGFDPARELHEQVNRVTVMRPAVILRAKTVGDRRVYRDIKLKCEESLYALAMAILDSFGFDEDHSFGFFSNLGRDYINSAECYELAEDANSNPARGVREVRVGQVFHGTGQKMQFIYDYGDLWRFELEVRGFDTCQMGEILPQVLAYRGKAPRQYVDEEDEVDPDNPF